MAEIESLPSLAGKLKELERRLGAMERSGTLRNTSMKEGTIIITDESGAPMVLVGRFDDGSYGLGVLDGSGNFVSIQNYIFGQQFDQEVATGSTDSTTAVDLGGPAVTVNVGPTGNVVVTAGAYIGIGATQTASVSLWIDGVSSGSVLGASNSNASGIAGSYQNSRLYSGLEPGPHLFELRYRVLSGPAADFSSRTLLVQPV